MRLLSSALSTDCYAPRLLSLRRFPNLASFTHLSPIINGWQVSDMEIDGGASEVEQDVRPDRNAKAAEVPQSVMLAARLERCRNKRDKYVGHIVQDRNQACYKDLVLKHMGVYSFYLLVDYWAKIGINKAGGTACCDQIFAFSHVHRYLWRPGGLQMASGMKSNGN